MSESVDVVRAQRGRPPWWLLAVVAGVLGLAVAGNFATGWRGRSDPTTTTSPPASVATLVARGDLVIVGRVVDVQRVGEPRDPAAVATVEVDRYLKGSADTRILVYDKGFRISWQRGEHDLLFLQRRLGNPPWRVDDRYLFQGDRLDAPFTVAEVGAAAGGATPP